MMPQFIKNIMWKEGRMKNHDCMPRKVVFGVESRTIFSKAFYTQANPASAVPVLDKI